jgi:hypothetical protein
VGSRRVPHRSGYRGGMRQPAVPYLEPVAGGLWWTVGAAALPGGPGTVVLAGGLGVTGGLVVALRRRHGGGVALPPGGRARLLRLLAAAVVVIAIAVTLLGLAGLGELSVPVACAITGGMLFPLSSLLEERSPLATGSALLVLGATGALLALDSAGSLYPQGLVGLVAGAVLWVAAAHRTGLIDEARERVQR